MDYCLRNPPRTIFDGPVCGNGFLEEGEECDCGMAKVRGQAGVRMLCMAIMVRVPVHVLYRKREWVC